MTTAITLLTYGLMYGIACHSMSLKHLILTYLRLVWINSGIIYGKLTYPEPEVDLECYVIMMMKLIRTVNCEGIQA